MHDQVLHDRHFHGHVSRTRQQRIIAEFAWADTKYKAVAFRALHSVGSLELFSGRPPTRVV
jgi:hypothetical protein